MRDSTSLRSCGLTVLRIVLGVVFLAHGWQKVFVLGLTGVTGMLTGMGIPLPKVGAPLLMAVELIGGALLMLGLATRWAAALIAADILVAISFVHWKHGFFASTQGVEFPLTLLAAAICLALAGPGNAALDAMFRKQA